jgi:hypothetical protein
MTKQILNSRVSQEVFAWLEAKAKADRRTLSEWVFLHFEDAMNADRRKAKRAGM